MNKVRRVERMVAMTKLLVDSPQKLISLNYFCDFFGMAKSTVSEDLTCVRQSMEHFQLGTLETVAGVAGGVRFIPHRKGEQANEILRDVQQRLREPDRIIPGGFIYMSDILYDWHVMTRLGEIIMTRFVDRNPDYILTVETKGIPLAVMVARAFNKPLVIARRDSKVTEGSAISINYVTGSSGRIQTMTLTKRAIPQNAKVLIIDDFMKAGGKAMVERVLETVQSLGTDKDVVIVGFGGNAVQDYLEGRAEFVRQEEQNGTGHAVKMAEPVLGSFDGTILLLCGDTPLVTKESLEALLKEHTASGAAATILTAHMPDPTGYGRIIRNEEGHVVRIVEQKDGKPEELAVQEVNTGMYAFDSKKLWPCLDQLSDDNAQGELYITDVVGILVNGGDKVSAYMTENFEESLGVNSRLQLAEAESILKHRKNVELMTAGVTIIDPDNTYVALEVTVGADTILHPGTVLEGNTVIGENCEIGPHTRLTNVTVGNNTVIHFTYGHDCEVKDGVDIGPYVHLRPNTVIGNKVHIGNFVEVKNSNVGEGTKFPHLSYIGDSDVGSGVNIGCGTITVNYDGKIKHRTTIGDGAFVGCNSNLVAPVTIGNYSYVGAGSTITKNVPDKALAVGRSKQIVKENWVTDDTFKKK